MRLARKSVRGRVYWFAEWEERAPDGTLVRRAKSLRLPPDSSRADAERLFFDARMTIEMREHAAPPPVRATVGEYADAYLASVRRTITARTHDRYALALARFAAVTGRDRPLADVTASDIETWVRGMERARHAPRTINLALAALRPMIRRALEDGVIPSDPLRTVRPARVAREAFPPYIPMPVYESVVDPALPDPVIRLACRLAMYAGLRAGEIAGLSWDDVDMVRGELRITSRAGSETKTGKSRTVPMLAPVREAIDAVRGHKRRKGGEHRVFPSIGTRKTVATYITHRWARTVRRIAATDPRVPVITFHGLRHSYATWLASSGLPLASLQIVLGHADIGMTMRYVHVQPHHVHDQIRAIAGAGGRDADL